jgi:bifunctional ADP-heptose synthase (sugar kinase/adenylyltransferase)
MEKELLNFFKDKKICVVGDTIIDVSYRCESLGLALETPTLKARLKNYRTIPGGALGVVSNLQKLCKSITFLTLKAPGEYMDMFKSCSKNVQIKAFYDASKINNVKRRYWVTRGEQEYKYFQLNTDCKKPISEEVEGMILAEIPDMLVGFDCVIISDYRNGFLTPKIIKHIISACNLNGTNVLINSQLSSNDIEHFQNFKDCSLLVVNESECNVLKKYLNCSNIKEVSKSLNCDICVTLGSKGSLLCVDGEEFNSPGVSTNVVDSCGAGDSFLASLALCDYENSPQESLNISNNWAALYVSTPKNHLPNLFDLKKKFNV